MSEKPQEKTIVDVKRLLRGLDPIMRKNILSYSERLPVSEKYIFVKNFLRNKKLDTPEGMKKYRDARSYGHRGCGKK